MILAPKFVMAGKIGPANGTQGKWGRSRHFHNVMTCEINTNIHTYAARTRSNVIKKYNCDLMCYCGCFTKVSDCVFFSYVTIAVTTLQNAKSSK